MRRVVLIASGAYVEPELQAEFGELPPAFLPLGNRRLFVHQRLALGDAVDRVLLSLPETFSIDETDSRLLGALGIEVVPVPGGLSLGQSIVYTINVCALAGESIAVLHGDTLLRPLDLEPLDAVTIDDAAPSHYQWGVVRHSGDGLDVLPEKVSPDEGEAILTGYFSFSNPAFLVQEITRNGGDFLRSLAKYTSAHTMQALRPAEWFDFGHAGTYYRSRRRVTTEREFNSLSLTRRSVIKTGSKRQKIEAEALWFETLPPSLRLYTPSYLDRIEDEGSTSYSLEYLHLPTLADLGVFGRLRHHAWERIFAGCDEFLRACMSHRNESVHESDSHRGLYLAKTLTRLEEFARAEGVNLGASCRLNGHWLPSLEQMATIAASAIPEILPSQHCLVHGDFCFSNILYDSRADVVRVIDPRGLDAEGRFSSFGDIRYDIGKLYHSAIGRYDHIIAGNYSVERRGNLEFDLELPKSFSIEVVEDVFARQSFGGLSVESAGAPSIAILLFLSMLPLHSDDHRRQMALLANAMRLFLKTETYATGFN